MAAWTLCLCLLLDLFVLLQAEERRGDILHRSDALKGLDKRTQQCRFCNCRRTCQSKTIGIGFNRMTFSKCTVCPDCRECPEGYFCYKDWNKCHQSSNVFDIVDDQPHEEVAPETCRRYLQSCEKRDGDDNCCSGHACCGRSRHGGMLCITFDYIDVLVLLNGWVFSFVRESAVFKCMGFHWAGFEDDDVRFTDESATEYSVEMEAQTLTEQTDEEGGSGDNDNCITDNRQQDTCESNQVCSTTGNNGVCFKKCNCPTGSSCNHRTLYTHPGYLGICGQFNSDQTCVDGDEFGEESDSGVLLITCACREGVYYYQYYNAQGGLVFRCGAPSIPECIYPVVNPPCDDGNSLCSTGGTVSCYGRCACQTGSCNSSAITAGWISLGVCGNMDSYSVCTGQNFGEQTFRIETQTTSNVTAVITTVDYKVHCRCLNNYFVYRDSATFDAKFECTGN